MAGATASFQPASDADIRSETSSISLQLGLCREHAAASLAEAFLATHTVLLHLCLAIVGLPYSFKGQMRMDEITGGSPYGASTLADGNHGDRQPSANGLAGARFQGRHVAEVANAMAIGRRQLQLEPA
jgi:multimeric flavodoxin WrbA